MKLNSIFTERKYQTWPSWDLVYEWEDIYIKKLGLSFYYERELMIKIGNRIPFFNKILGSDVTFAFEMSHRLGVRYLNHKYIIPCIVDFYIHLNEIPSFESSYSKNPIVFISSLDAYNYLKENRCLINIAHLPLSISDIYSISDISVFKKEYDLVLVGRQNPVLESYLKEYIRKYPDFRYVYRIQKGGQFLYFCSDGEELGNINTRAKYMELIRKSKCGLYSTPSIDEGEKNTNGFNQVTPRFLELIACGCHVIARYKDNSDTNYYQLSKFSKNIGTYEVFEKELSEKLGKNVNMKFYSDYLKMHYTSCRVIQTTNIIENL